MSYSLGLQVGETAAAAAVARGPHIDVHVLPVEPNLGGVGTAAPERPFGPMPWRGDTPSRRAGGPLLAPPAAPGPALLVESIMRAAFAAVVPSEPDELVSIALAHPTAWTVEQVDAGAAAAAATAPPAVLTQLVPAAVAVAADYCTIAMLGDGDAVLVCDLFESAFEVTAVGRDGDRLVLLGEQTETPSVGVGGLGPAPEQRGSLSGGGGEGEHDGSGLWASDLAGAVRRALQTAHLHRAVVVDVVLSGPAAGQRWLQQAAAEASGFGGVQVLPYSASRGAAQMAVVAAPPAAGGSPSSPEVGRHTADAERVPFGHTTGGAAPAAAAGGPGPGPLSASGGPWLPPTAAPPRRRRPRPGGGGRAGLVAVVVAAALGLFSVALFEPSWIGLSSAEPGSQSPAVVVVEPSPSSSEDDGLVGDGLAPTPPSPPPSVAPSAAGEAPAAVAESVDEPTILAEVPVGSTPGFAATPPPGAAAGQQLYVANRAAGVLTVVDTARNAVRGTIPIDDGPPQYLAFSRDGTRAYVSVFSERNNAVNRVVVVDTIRGGVVASIPVGTRPYALAVTPDAAGSEVWVPNHDAASVSIIDTATNTVTKTVPVAANPHWVAFSPDGRFAYTANHESNLITVLEVATKKVVGEVRVGKSPHSVAASPTEPLVANVNYDGHSVSVIDTRTNKVVSTIEHVGSHPQALAWAPDGRHFYTANVDDGTVSVVNAASMTVTARIPTGKSPTSVAVDPTGHNAYVTNLRSGTVTVLKIGG